MLDPASRLTRKYAGELEPAELCRLYAAAIVRGEGPAHGAALRGASWQASSAWNGVVGVLNTGKAALIHAIDIHRLTAQCKTLARLAAMTRDRGDTWEESEARGRRMEEVADLHDAEHVERTADAAVRIAGLRAWSLDALGVDVLDVLEGWSIAETKVEPVDLDSAGEPVTPERIAAWWQYARGIVAEILADGAPDVEAVEASAATWAAMARPG